jgi:hypothetical protein
LRIENGELRMGLFEEAEVGIADGGTGFFFEIEVDHFPAGFGGGFGAELDGEAVEAGFLAVGLAAPGGAAFEVGADHFAVALGDRDAGGPEALGVQPIERFMDLEPNAVGMGMLPEPFVFPGPPMPPGLQMHEGGGVGIGLKGTVTRAEIGIRQSQGRDRLPTVGTVNLRTKDRILQHRTQHLMGQAMVRHRGHLDRGGGDGGILAREVL